MDKINISGIWTMLTGTVLAVVYMFSTFATAADVEKKAEELNKKFIQQETTIAYGQYYDRFDDWEEAVSEGRDKLAKEYKREMERLKAKICEENPKWERCNVADEIE